MQLVSGPVEKLTREDYINRWSFTQKNTRNSALYSSTVIASFFGGGGDHWIYIRINLGLSTISDILILYLALILHHLIKIMCP